MKRIIAGTIQLLLIMCSVVLISCNGQPKAIQQNISERDQIQVIENEIEENVYPLPTSAKVIKMLTDLEIGYTFGLSNPVQNVKKYFSSAKKAINLGVYGADLSYSTLYNMEQELINYLDVIGSLFFELNMSKIYDRELYNNIRKNFDNRDELVNILTKSFNETYSYLSDNDQNHLALLVVGGAWVEGMYLTTHVTYASYQFAGFAVVLLEQKESFELLLELVQPYITDSDISDFVKLLEPVKNVYAGIGTSLTERDIIDITRVITEVREEIIK